MDCVCSAVLGKQLKGHYSIASMSFWVAVRLSKEALAIVHLQRFSSFSLQHNMPFWRISSHSDLLALHQALEFEYL